MPKRSKSMAQTVGSEVVFSQHIKVSKPQLTLAAIGEEGGKLSCRRAARVLHARFVGCELHEEQVPVVGIAVLSQDGAVRDAMPFGGRHPRVEVGVELVDPGG